MRKIISELLCMFATIGSIIMWSILMVCWVFYPETFKEIPTNDLIMIVTIILIGFMPDKK